MKELSPLFQRSIRVIHAIPNGKVSTYSALAELIEAPGCARHISYILSSSSQKYELPWHRVINSKGRISLPVHSGYFRQKKILEAEGIQFESEKIELNIYMWKPTKKYIRQLLKGLPPHIPKKGLK